MTEVQTSGPALDSPIPQWQPQRYLVRRNKRETKDTVTLQLEAADPNTTDPLPKPKPGQFNMLYLFGRGEAPISVSGLAHHASYLHHTVKAAGALTQAMTELLPGDLVGLRGPYGNGWPLAQARGKNVLLIAGGIGVAPIRAALRAIVRHRKRYGHVDLIYGSRTPQDILYRDQLARWQQRKDIDVHLTVDHGDPEWTGTVGFVTELLSNINIDARNTTAFLCGPEIMMRHALSELLQLGVRLQDVHLSIERNMRCALGICGHCQWGADFICRQGPVFCADHIRSRLQIREL